MQYVPQDPRTLLLHLQTERVTDVQQPVRTVQVVQKKLPQVLELVPGLCQGRKGGWVIKVETDGGGQIERKVIEKKGIELGCQRERDGTEEDVREHLTVKYVCSTFDVIFSM